MTLGTPGPGLCELGPARAPEIQGKGCAPSEVQKGKVFLASANFPGKWGESPSNSRAAPHLWAQVREQGHDEQLPQLGALGGGSERVCTCLDLHEGMDVTWCGSALPF